MNIDKMKNNVIKTITGIRLFANNIFTPPIDISLTGFYRLHLY